MSKPPGCILRDEEVGVAGYDDIPTVRDITPALTTVRIPLEEVGRQALRLATAPRSANDSTDNTSDGTGNVAEPPAVRS